MKEPKEKEPVGCRCCGTIGIVGDFCETCRNLIADIAIFAKRKPVGLKRVLREAGIWPYKKMGTVLK